MPRNGRGNVITSVWVFEKDSFSATSFHPVPWNLFCTILQVFCKRPGMSLRTLVSGTTKFTINILGRTGTLSGPRWPGAQRSSPHNERRLHLRFGIPAESAFDSASGKSDSYITLKQFSNFQMSCYKA